MPTYRRAHATESRTDKRQLGWRPAAARMTQGPLGAPNTDGGCTQNGCAGWVSARVGDQAAFAAHADGLHAREDAAICFQLCAACVSQHLGEVKCGQPNAG